MMTLINNTRRFHKDDGSQNKFADKMGNPVDFDNKNVSDYAESLVTLMPTNQYSHGDAGGSF